MSRSPRPPHPERPDTAQRLLAAVAEGDSPKARGLAERLVHRQGVAGFEIWLDQCLQPAQGATAVHWLRAELEFPQWQDVDQQQLGQRDLDQQHLGQPELGQQELGHLGDFAQPDWGHSLPPTLAEQAAASSAAGFARALAALSSPEALADPAPAPAAVRRLRSWLQDLPQAS
jgi:hypothetical protein